MKNQQAISVTTIVFTATSFIEACKENLVYLYFDFQLRRTLETCLGPFEGEGVLGESADPLDGPDQVPGPGGRELHLGVLGHGGQVLQDEPLPHPRKLHQRHG